MTTEPESTLHPDFANLVVQPGTAQIMDAPERFNMVNVLAFGCAATRRPHEPAILGRVGSVVCWESTGADDALPFWNTNLTSDVYLYLVHGQVRVEFKELEGSHVFGQYLGRTGDLMLLPKGIAHRTFSVDGKRRVSLEVLQYDERWDGLQRYEALDPDPSLSISGMTFRPGPVETTIELGGARVSTSTAFLLRGCRALVAYGCHLGHNEFEGGFIIADADDGVLFKVAGEEISCRREPALSVLKGLVDALEQRSTMEADDEH